MKRPHEAFPALLFQEVGCSFHGKKLRDVGLVHLVHKAGSAFPDSWQSLCGLKGLQIPFLIPREAVPAGNYLDFARVLSCVSISAT